MKRVMFTMVLAIANLVIFAHGNNFSTINIRTNNNRTLMIAIDGNAPIAFNYQSNEIPVQPGNRMIQIIEVMPRTGYYNNGYGNGHNYYHHNNQGNHVPTQQVVYTGYLSIPANAKMFATYSNRYGLTVDNTVFANTCPPAPRPNNGCGNNNNYGNNHPDHHQQGYGNNNTYYTPAAMYSNDFNNLKNTIAGQSFENTKIDILKQAAANNSFTTNQVIELAQLFTFESYKLEAAKLLYTKTIDQQNYYQVNNIFTFSSSIAELNKFINRV